MNAKVSSTSGGLVLFALGSTTVVSTIAVVSHALTAVSGAAAILALIGALGIEAAKVGAPDVVHRLFLRGEPTAAKIIGGIWAAAFAICATATFIFFSQAPTNDAGAAAIQAKTAAIRSLERSAEDIEDYEVYRSYQDRISVLKGDVANLRAAAPSRGAVSVPGLAMGSIGVLAEIVSAMGLLFLRWMTLKETEAIIPPAAPLTPLNDPRPVVVGDCPAPPEPTAVLSPPTDGGEGVEFLPPSAPPAFVSAALPIDPQKETKWMWKDVAPYGALTLLTGQPKVGKSQIAVYMAATVSTGGLWPDGGRADLGDVILMETEDFLADTQRRLTAAGADLSRIVIRDSEAGPLDLTTAEGMKLLKEQAKSMTSLKLLVVSPVLAFLGRGSNADADVRSRIEPLRLWAAQNRIAVLMIIHPAKNAGKSLQAQFAGADGFRRAARSAYVAMTDPANPKRRVLVCAGVNGGDDSKSFPYSIQGVDLGQRSTSRIVWGVSSASTAAPADEPQAIQDTPPQAPPIVSVVVDDDNGGEGDPLTSIEMRARLTRKEEYKIFLKGILANRPMPVGEIQRLAREAGLTGGNAALYKAAEELFIDKGDRQAFGGPGLWSLPKRRDAQTAEEPI